MIDKVDENALIKTKTWEKVRNDIKKLSPEFCNIIDNIDPDKTLNLLQIRYPFGTKIINNGVLTVPNANGGYSSITDKQTCYMSLQKHLGYDFVPLGFITKNKVEVFIEMSNRVFSLAVFDTGLDIGIWEYFGWTTPCSMTAGARSLYMLPKIASAIPHNRLKQAFGISAPPPKNVLDHWQVFREIANSRHFAEPWHCEILFFPVKWIEKLRSESGKNKAWSDLRNHLFDKMNQHSSYGKRREILDIVWHLFAQTLSKRNLRVTPYILDTLKHLVFECTGGIPASLPYHGSNDLGPLSTLQRCYLDIYQIDYHPTIMQPHYFSINNPTPVYYSLQTPTLLESVPRNNDIKSILAIVRDLRDLIEIFSKEKFESHLKIESNTINDILEKISFDFFHTDPPVFGGYIQSSAKMPKEDPALLFSPENSKQRAFAENSSFLRGCVRITDKR